MSDETTQPDTEDRITRERREHAAMKAALTQIAEWTMSQPAALNMPNDQWYRNQAFSMIGLAAHTLAKLRQ